MLSELNWGVKPYTNKPCQKLGSPPMVQLLVVG